MASLVGKLQRGRGGVNVSERNATSDAASRAKRAKQFGVYTPELLAERCKELGTAVHLVEGLIPPRV